MTPWELAGLTEHSHQRALFAWANCAALYGFAVADDPRGYTLATRPLCPPAPPMPILSRLFAIHNQGHGDAIRGGKAKAEGVKAGVPDTMLPVPIGGYCGLFVELKIPKLIVAGKVKRSATKTSDKQNDWLAFLTAQGYKAVTATGWQEAAQAIKDYVNAGSSQARSPSQWQP